MNERFALKDSAGKSYTGTRQRPEEYDERRATMCESYKLDEETPRNG
jgi:hypothetical protein